MDSNLKPSECCNFRPKTEENRKRAASGRLSPRTLFGNLKVKRPFLDEDIISRNLNNSKNTHGWKPPLKVDSNETSNKFSSYDCDMETLSQSFPNHETNSSQNQNCIVNEPHYSGSYENVYITENSAHCHVESGEIFTDNSKETTIHNQSNLMNDQILDYSEDNICGDLDNYINNSEDTSEKDTDGIQIDCRQNQDDRNLFQPVTEKLDYSGNNHEYLKRSFQESNILQQLSPSRNEKQNYDTLSQDTVKLERDNLGEYMDMETHYKDEEQENSEKSDSSKSTLELSDSKNFPMGPNDKKNKNVLSQKINQGNFHEDTDKETRDSYVTGRVDDSFDTGVTNSQFLQLENQISKSSIGINTKNCYDNRPLLNNIETMKRYCTSLATQTEWQKNILKCITQDIDDLNKAIVNVTGVLRSLRKDNASAK